MARSRSTKTTKEATANGPAPKKAVARPTATPAVDTRIAHATEHTRRTARKAKASTPQTTGSRGRVSDELIRARAHEIYLTRGGASGDALSDWLQAEHELRSREMARSPERETT